jgi:hypothetical protein
LRLAWLGRGTNHKETSMVHRNSGVVANTENKQFVRLSYSQI